MGQPLSASLLSPLGIMRYYLPFPEAIPHLRTCSHTLLTRPLLVVLLQPFNLHVLGLPPAFVLSQDQTLIFIPNISARPAHLLSNYCLFLNFLLTRTLQKLYQYYTYLFRLHSSNAHELAHLSFPNKPSVHLFLSLIHTVFKNSSNSGSR